MVNIAGEFDASIDKQIKTFKFEAIEGKSLSDQISRHYPIDNTGKHYLIQEVTKDG
jgi:hypothetical protein